MPSDRGKRRLIDPDVAGCYEDNIGRVITVWFERNHERRLPKATPIRKMIQLRAALLAEVSGVGGPGVPSTRHARDKAGKAVAQVTAASGPTLKAAGAAYLDTLTGHLRDSRACEVGAWVALLGDEVRVADLTPEAVAAAAVPWYKAHEQRRPGFAASTLKKRRHTLRCVIRHALGRKALDVTLDLPRVKEPRLAARGIPRLAIRYILAEFENRGAYQKGGGDPGDNLTRLRCELMAETGFPHSTIKALQPRDVDYKAGTVEVGERSKGEGADPRVIAVTRRALDVLRRFFAARASGPFSSRALRFRFRVAVAKAAVKFEAEQALVWPVRDDVRPYDLRHSFGTEHYRKGRDPIATAHAMLHAPGSPMTVRYVRGAVDDSAAAVRDLLDAADEAPLTLSPSPQVEAQATGTAGKASGRKAGRVLKIGGGR